MAERRLLAVAVPSLITLLAFAACLEAPADASHAADGHDHAGMPEGLFEMAGERCEEGGFVALYPLQDGQKRAKVWELVDIRDEVGNPLRDGNGRPLSAPAMGNWHQGYRCVSATSGGGMEKEYIFGWIGNMIKAPAWDPGGADLHFIISGLGFGNGTIADGLRSTTTAAVSHAYEPTRVTWYAPQTAPRSAVHAIYSDVEKGIYTSYSTMHKYRDFPERTIRLWWQVPADGSQAHASHDHFFESSDPQAEPTAWHPVYWDLKTRGGEQYTTPPVDSVEAACHLGNDDHANTPTGKALGGACQPTLTTVYQHKGVEFRSGQVFEDVTLTEIWKH